MTHHPRSDQTTTQSSPSNDVSGPGDAVTVRYDVTIVGEPGDVLLGAFSDVTVRRAPGVTVLSADLDQAGASRSPRAGRRPRDRAGGRSARGRSRRDPRAAPLRGHMRRADDRDRALGLVASFAGSNRYRTITTPPARGFRGKGAPGMRWHADRHRPCRRSRSAGRASRNASTITPTVTSSSCAARRAQARRSSSRNGREHTPSRAPGSRSTRPTTPRPFCCGKWSRRWSSSPRRVPSSSVDGPSQRAIDHSVLWDVLYSVTQHLGSGITLVLDDVHRVHDRTGAARSRAPRRASP